MHKHVQSLVVVALLGVSVSAGAQGTKSAPWLVIQRELVKPGKAGPHAKHEVAWARALEAAKYPGGALAMSAMSGAPEVWWISGYNTAADIQKLNEAYADSPALQAVDDKFVAPEADYVASTISMTAVLRDSLSYSSGTPLAAMRYVMVSRVLVRPGHNDEFLQARRLIKAAHETAHATDGFAVYQVTAGAASGTYLIFAGKKSMAEFDTNPHGPAYVAALGGAEGQKKLADLAASYTTNGDANLFQLNPQYSVLSKAWYDADPFWKPKAPAAGKK